MGGEFRAHIRLAGRYRDLEEFAGGVLHEDALAVVGRHQAEVDGVALLAETHDRAVELDCTSREGDEGSILLNGCCGVSIGMRAIGRNGHDGNRSDREKRASHQGDTDRNSATFAVTGATRPCVAYKSLIVKGV